MMTGRSWKAWGWPGSSDRAPAPRPSSKPSAGPSSPGAEGPGGMSLVPPVLAGDRLALARLLTQLENETPEGLQDLSALYGHTGQAHRVGITGAPGTGKSALVNRLVQELRSQTDSPQIAIVAVDPSSPFSGGAILGDRIRMRDLSGDPGVF